MSLDGYLGKSWKDVFKKHFISFDDDGYYWELYPTFEKVGGVTGQIIDLYYGADFNNQTQIFLKQCLEHKLNEVNRKKSTWQVVTGWHGTKNRKNEILATVSKERLIRLIETFLVAIEKAQKENKHIIFLGD